MKSPFALPAACAALLATLLTTQLSGCGQTGPLYLPKPPAKPASANVPPKAEASTALPSTAPVPQQ